MKGYDIAVLLQNQHYMAVMEKLDSFKPVVPRYDPKTNNVEMMKYQSAQYEMYKMMMSILKPTQSGA